MEKVILIPWILWFCWMLCQTAAELTGVAGLLLAILSILAGLIGIGWTLFWFKSSPAQTWPLTTTETVVAVFCLVARPLWLITGYRRVYRRFSNLAYYSFQRSDAVSSLLYGESALLARIVTLTFILLILAIWHGLYFVLTFLFVYLILLFLWFCANSGSLRYGFSRLYGDFGYDRAGLRLDWYEFVYLCGETLLPVLVWVTLLIEPTRSFLASRIGLHV